MLASLAGLVVASVLGFVVEWRTSVRVDAMGSGRAAFRQLTWKRLEPGSGRSRRSTRALGIGYPLAIGGAAGVRLLAPELHMPGPAEVWIAAGIAVAILASALRTWAVVTLGCLFDRDGLLRERHVLVRTGPYGFVRHPAYAANVVFAVAAGIILANWASLFVATVLAVLVHAPRIRFEEALLTSRFSAEYPAYRRHTGGLLPRLPRTTSAPWHP